MAATCILQLVTPHMYNADPCLCYTRVACIPRLVLYGHILRFRHTTTAEIIHYPHRYILNTTLANQLDSDCCVQYCFLLLAPWLVLAQRHVSSNNQPIKARSVQVGYFLLERKPSRWNASSLKSRNCVNTR